MPRLRLSAARTQVVIATNFVQTWRLIQMRKYVQVHPLIQMCRTLYRRAVENSVLTICRPPLEKPLEEMWLIDNDSGSCLSFN